MFMYNCTYLQKLVEGTFKVMPVMENTKISVAKTIIKFYSQTHLDFLF